MEEVLYGFSFPSTPIHDRGTEFEFEFEFEFGSTTPDSPSSDTSKNSPADHLFLNGKLLPHSFPCQKTNSVLMGSFTTRTSSVSSKDSSYSSLMSSRSSSSSNSRSSSSSSARTSYSSVDNSERRLLYHSVKAWRSGERYKAPSNKDVVAQLYGSQRWQFITPPMPSLSQETSRRRKSPEQAVTKEEKKPNKAKNKKTKKKSFCRRFFESFMASCKQCHAMETQVLEDNNNV